MGEFAKTNYDNAITRDNLLSMLYPRLVLAKQLLSDEGVIFCSIDDKNQAYVKCLFDEVFGEQNFVGNFIWKNSATSQSAFINIEHEYIMTYCKNKTQHKTEYNRWKIKRDKKIIDYLYKNINACTTVEDKRCCLNQLIKQLVDSHPEDSWLKNYHEVSKKGLIYYPADASTPGKPKSVELKNGVVLPPLPNRAWLSVDYINEALDNDRIEWKNGRPYIIKYIEEAQDEIHSVCLDNVEEVDSIINQFFTRNGKELLKIIFNTQTPPFEFPKPFKLIEKILSIFKSDITVLDFFAGSGTTGQAVLELNKEDGGKRTFILCTNNEITNLNPNGIAYDVTSKRLKRVMTGECYDGTNDFEWIKKNKALGGTLDVYEIGEISNSLQDKGDNPFEVIDETLYGLKKLLPEQKIEWVCNNFEHTQKYLEDITK